MRYLSQKFINKIDELAQIIINQIRYINIIDTKFDVFNDIINKYGNIFIQQNRQFIQQRENIQDGFQ